MIPKPEQQTINTCLNNIAKNLPGFKSRPGQHQMITAVAQTLVRAQKPAAENEELVRCGESILVIEGPTGTGKTLGYLLPAIVMARSLDKKLVVSSATVALQEQLANKDIPFLAQQTGLNISYVMAKGRGRYACTYRLKQYLGAHDSTSEQNVFFDTLDNNDQPYPSSQSEIKRWQHLSDLLDQRQWSGDRDALAEPLPDNLWSKITTDRHGCLKKSCAYLNTCPFFIARHQLDTANIIIANHDLVLADLAMGGGIILPHPSETFYCIDEAHHIADKAIKQFAASHALNGTLAWLEKIKLTTMRIQPFAKNYNQFSQIESHTTSIANYLIDLRHLLSSLPELKFSTYTLSSPLVLRFANGILPPGIFEISTHLATATTALYLLLDALYNTLLKNQNDASFGKSGMLSKILADLGFLLGRVENLKSVWQMFIHPDSQQEPPLAKWITAEYKHAKDEVEYTICASPVRAATLLTDNLWRQAAGVILTSATLRSLGTFNLFLTETGLGNFSAVTCIALESPFNFKQQGRLVIPSMRSDPSAPDIHTREVIELLPQLIQSSGGNGTLVLFSSKKQMHDVAQGIPETLRTLLLIQGEHSKAALIQTHLTRISMNSPSVLFGLASLAEGLDLPGTACNHVIIAKLPFAMPDDPVSKTLTEWIEQQGKNSFFTITLPSASIKLIQAVGRLIRTETDTGTVTILDTRLKTKRYGQQMLKSLPPFNYQP